MNDGKSKSITTKSKMKLAMCQMMSTLLMPRLYTLASMSCSIGRISVTFSGSLEYFCSIFPSALKKLLWCSTAASLITVLIARAIKNAVFHPGCLLYSVTAKRRSSSMHRVAFNRIGSNYSESIASVSILNYNFFI